MRPHSNGTIETVAWCDADSYHTDGDANYEWREGAERSPASRTSPEMRPEASDLELLRRYGGGDNGTMHA